MFSSYPHWQIQMIRMSKDADPIKLENGLEIYLVPLIILTQLSLQKFVYVFILDEL